MPHPATGDLDDDPEELYDDELLEDDEIDDDAAMRSNKPLSKGSLGDRDGGSDDDNAGLKGTNHDNGKSAQRRPPRPTRSSSLGRKVQGGGSMHRRRATRRVTPSDKKRSSSGGSPPITVRDIMGSEKKATAVGITHSGHTRPTVSASPMKGSKTGAEEKRSMIRSRWKEKQNRQTDVKNSLAQFLSTESQSEDSDLEFLIDPEDEEIISDVDDDDNNRPNSENALDLDHDEGSDDAKSVKSSKSHQRRRRGSTRKSEAQDGEMQGSNHSRSRRTSRRRVKKPTGGSDDKSVGGVPSRKSTRHSPRPVGEDHDTTRQRATDDGRSVDGDTLRRHRDADDGHRKTRSSSTRRKPSESDGAKSRSTRRKGHNDDDDRSVGSRKSVGGRRRRQPSQRTKAASSDVPHTPKPHSSSRVSDDKGSASPLSSKPSSSSSVAEGGSKSHLLSKHIESATKPKTLQDLEERSEESSRFSANYDQPTSLLQFDPTNANNIKLVKQDKASMTSERIRNADGTESEFHISKLAGLPTFESSNPNFDNWDNSASELGHQSTRSLGSVGYESDDHAAKAHKSMSNLGYTPKRNGTAQDTGLNQSGRNGRGVGRSNTPGRSRGVTSSKSFQDSMKGLFGVWNKKGECESCDEEDDQPKGNRFFRKREDIAHQALDDDGSDEN